MSEFTILVHQYPHPAREPRCNPSTG